MFAIFSTKENKYYGPTNQDRWVDNIMDAQRFKSEESAKNLAKNNLIGKIDFLEYVEILPTLTKEEAEETYKEVQDAVAVFNNAIAKVPALIKYYSTIQSEQEKIQEDLLHKFEFMPPNNLMFVKFSRMLQNCRITRRDAKNRLEYLGVINESKGKDIPHLSECIQKPKKYTARIMPELFN